jgi:primosomal protein N' (replication factor Y)
MSEISTPPKELFAHVAIEGVSTDRPYTYAVPADIAQSIGVGVRVLVPFGKKERLGFVVHVFESDDSGYSLKEILDVFDNGQPVISDTLLRLTKWISDYYISSHTEAISASLPAALRIRPKETVTLQDFTLQAEADTKLVRTKLRKEIIKALTAEKKLTTVQLARRVGSKNLSLALAELERTGFVAVKKSFEQQAKPKFKSIYLLGVSQDELPKLKLTKKQSDVLTLFLAASKPALFPEELGIREGVLKTLVSRRILKSEQREVTKTFKDNFFEKQKVIMLTDEQLDAAKKISEQISSNSFKTFLLYGITGSGKTLVYIEAVKTALGLGKTAIVLVPEIGLTPQTAARFRNEFGDEVRVLHSAMSDREKLEAWQALKNGKAKIALGPRSAVFAPLENVGVIIVDEEHESTYKQFDKSPRYNARDVAVVRAKFENAVCVLGSATPALESFYNAETGKYTLLKLTKRAAEIKLPEIKIVSLIGSQRASYSVSETLKREIERRLFNGEQVILFQNRRGFASSVQCEACGAIHKCKDCNVAMTFHLAEHHLRCHYCGRTEPIPHECSSCHSSKLSLKGSGTERIEEEISQLFPSEKLVRMDLDTTSKKGSHSKILKEFGSGKSRILIGTQMVAKGLDFPKVTLVGVLVADTGLLVPDFRASERVYSLLTQVAGRAGRSNAIGEVLMQVYDTGNDIFKLILRHDYEVFYRHEIESRRELSYPPFSRIAKIEFSGKVESDVKEASETFARILKQELPNVLTLGPAPAGLARVRGNFRYQVLLKQLSVNFLTKDVFLKCRKTFLETSSFKLVRLQVDVDSMSVL